MLKTLISVATIVGICFSAYFFLDKNYASAAELQKIEQRLDYKIKSDQFNSIQERIWKLEDRYTTTNTMPETVKEEFRKLQIEKELLEKHLEKHIEIPNE